MKTLEDRINFVLSNTRLSCQEVADLLACPLEEVHKVVEKRWAKHLSKGDNMEYLIGVLCFAAFVAVKVWLLTLFS